MNDLSQRLHRIALLPDGGRASDCELLERFLSGREEAAFEVLLRRHGPMVLGVCRRILRDYHHAEDAFQATFLILVRKAAAIRKRDSIASWLYGVACRTATRARTVLSRRQNKERPMCDIPSPENPQTLSHELGPILDEELLRLPVVLCDLEGKTRKEAARLVGCPEGTLSTRLMRARARLARRLIRRGLMLSAGALDLVLSEQGASAAVPSWLLTATMRGAANLGLAQAAGAVSPQVVALTDGVLRTMLWTQVMKGAALVLTAGLLCTGLALPAQFGLAIARQKPKGPGPQLTTKATAPQPDPIPDALRKKLTARVSLDKGIDGNTPVKDALEFLADRYDLALTVDVDRFKTAGINDNVTDAPVSLPVLFHVRLATILRMIAKQVGGVCLTSSGKVVIVPDDEKTIKELLAQGHARLPPSLPDEEAQRHTSSM